MKMIGTGLWDGAQGFPADPTPNRLLGHRDGAQGFRATHRHTHRRFLDGLWRLSTHLFTGAGAVSVTAGSA